MVSTTAPVKAGLLPKDLLNKCRVFSVIHLLDSTNLGRFATRLESIRGKTERGYPQLIILRGRNRRNLRRLSDNTEMQTKVRLSDCRPIRSVPSNLFSIRCGMRLRPCTRTLPLAVVQRVATLRKSHPLAHSRTPAGPLWRSSKNYWRLASGFTSLVVSRRPRTGSVSDHLFTVTRCLVLCIRESRSAPTKWIRSC